MERVRLIAILKVELPGRSILLCDGGFVDHDGERYLSSDVDFGTVAGFEALEEGAGDSLPAGTITFYPPSIAAAATLSQPGYQGSRITMSIIEQDPATGAVIDVDRMADWQSDRTILRRKKGMPRALEMLCVTRSQRLLARNEGNVLSSAFHQRQYPGERGFDNAHGMPTQVAWGVASPPRGVSFGGGGGFGGGPGGGGGMLQYAF
jgi:hypothetical protein